MSLRSILSQHQAIELKCATHRLSKLVLRSKRRPRVCTQAMLPQEITLQSHLELLQSMLPHLEGHATLRMLHIADAVAVDPPRDNGWLQPLVTGLETVLKTIQGGLDKYKVPYSYGWSIIALTALVKLATFPFTKKQVESSMAVQRLKPKIDAIKERYGEEKEAVQRETNALYEKAGVDPLAGCLPSIATIPIFIGLYRSLSSLAQEGTLEGQGFYWIPSLAGPTTIAANRAGSGIAWLYPFVDGHPPIGWDLASKYLVLPIAVVIAQWISSAIISPPVDPNSDNANTQRIIVTLLPLMVGWFALSLPSGLSLYYFSNTVLTSTQQIFLRKLGGVRLGELDLGPIELGKARRTGEAADVSEKDGVVEINADPIVNDAADNISPMASTISVEEMEAAVIVPTVNRRCKRKRLELNKKVKV